MPPLPAAANSELVWQVQGRKLRLEGAVTHQRPHGYPGTDMGQRETNPTCSILCEFLSGGRENQPEKAMAPHSSVLAWRIPGMGEPGGLPSVGSHRVGHD